MIVNWPSAIFRRGHSQARAESSSCDRDGLSCGNVPGGMAFDVDDVRAEARRLPIDEVLGLLGIALYPMRRKCGLLAWHVLQRALPAPAGSTAAGSGADPSPPRGRGHRHDHQ